MILLAAFATCAHAQPEDALPEAELHQLNSSFDVDDGMRVRLDNPYGSVRIRAVPLVQGGEFRVVVQTPVGRDNPLRLKRTRDGSTLLLGVEADGPKARLTPDHLLRADFVVALPDRVELDVSMARGDFTMHAASYPVKLRGDRGTVRLRTTGRVDVEWPHGHVIYHLDGDDPVTGGRIQTSSAPIDVLRADLDRLRFETLSGAAVTTDSLPILAAREAEGRIERFGTDRETALLRLQSDTGPIRLVAHGLR